MANENIVVEREGKVATISINRPKVMNALNDSVFRELDAAIEELGGDPNVRALIITGAGDRAFVAGADINELNALTCAAEAQSKSLWIQSITLKIERLAKPVIAAINGFALGGGLELAMACDVRLAADSARLGQPEVNLGLIPGMGGTQRLSRLVGKGWAKLVCMSGDHIDADTAQRIGLVEKVIPASELMTAARELANKLSGQAPVAIAAIKHAIDEGIDLDLDRGLAIEAAQFAIAVATEDRIEGTGAFLQKRKPVWTGR